MKVYISLVVWHYILKISKFWRKKWKIFSKKAAFEVAVITLIILSKSIGEVPCLKSLRRSNNIYSKQEKKRMGSRKTISRYHCLRSFKKFSAILCMHFCHIPVFSIWCVRSHAHTHTASLMCVKNRICYICLWHLCGTLKRRKLMKEKKHQIQ